MGMLTLPVPWLKIIEILDNREYTKEDISADMDNAHIDNQSS